MEATAAAMTAHTYSIVLWVLGRSSPFAISDLFDFHLQDYGALVYAYALQADNSLLRAIDKWTTPSCFESLMSASLVEVQNCSQPGEVEDDILMELLGWYSDDLSYCQEVEVPHWDTRKKKQAEDDEEH
ncbi:unnamed protein product [Sphagnum balticum]